MLVLNRKVGEKIQIGNNITITILEIRGSKVRIGIEAPAGVLIRRDEQPSVPLGVPPIPQPFDDLQNRVLTEPFRDQRIGRDCFWCMTIDSVPPTE